MTVIGGGLSGLATAWRLAARGAHVTVLERRVRTGGVIRSERVDGFLCEAAPNSVLLKSASAEGFLEDLGLSAAAAHGHPRVRSDLGGSVLLQSAVPCNPLQSHSVSYDLL